MTSFSGMPPTYTPTIHAKRERENADVELGEAADENGDDQRGERYVRQIHAPPSFIRSDRSSTAGCTARSPVKSFT